MKTLLLALALFGFAQTAYAQNYYDSYTAKEISEWSWSQSNRESMVRAF